MHFSRWLGEAERLSTTEGQVLATCFGVRSKAKLVDAGPRSLGGAGGYHDMEIACYAVDAVFSFYRVVPSRQPCP